MAINPTAQAALDTKAMILSQRRNEREGQR